MVFIFWGLMSRKPWRQGRVVVGRDSWRTSTPFSHGLSLSVCLLGPSKSLTTQRPCPSRFEEQPRRASLLWAEVSYSLVCGASWGRIVGVESRMPSASSHSLPEAPTPGSSCLWVRPGLEPWAGQLELRKGLISAEHLVRASHFPCPSFQSPFKRCAVYDLH